MLRLMLNDELWSKLRAIVLQHSIYDKPNLRMIMEAMLYRMRVFMATYVGPFDVLFGCLPNIQGSIMRSSYVYILASQRNGTLYVSSTLDIMGA